MNKKALVLNVVFLSLISFCKSDTVYSGKNINSIVFPFSIQHVDTKLCQKEFPVQTFSTNRGNEMGTLTTSLEAFKMAHYYLSASSKQAIVINLKFSFLLDWRVRYNVDAWGFRQLESKPRVRQVLYSFKFDNSQLPNNFNTIFSCPNKDLLNDNEIGIFNDSLLSPSYSTNGGSYSLVDWFYAPKDLLSTPHDFAVDGQADRAPTIFNINVDEFGSKQNDRGSCYVDYLVDNPSKDNDSSSMEEKKRLNAVNIAPEGTYVPDNMSANSLGKQAVSFYSTMSFVADSYPSQLTFNSTASFATGYSVFGDAVQVVNQSINNFIIHLNK
jgi:hypothetical protein